MGMPGIRLGFACSRRQVSLARPLPATAGYGTSVEAPVKLQAGVSLCHLYVDTINKKDYNVLERIGMKGGTASGQGTTRAN